MLAVVSQTDHQQQRQQQQLKWRPEVLSAAKAKQSRQSRLKLANKSGKSSLMIQHHNAGRYAADQQVYSRWRSGDRISKTKQPPPPSRWCHDEQHEQRLNNGQRSASCSMSNTLISDSLSRQLSPSTSQATTTANATTTAQKATAQTHQTLPTTTTTTTTTTPKTHRQPPYPHPQSSSSSTTVCLLSHIILLQLILLLILSPFISSVYAATTTTTTTTTVNKKAVEQLQRHLLLPLPSLLEKQLVESNAHFVDRRQDNNLSRQQSPSSSVVEGQKSLNSRAQNGECYRLLQFFTWLKAAYPALTNHLFALATKLPANTEHQQQQLGSRASQAIAQITLMLEEANHLASSRRQHSSSELIFAPISPATPQPTNKLKTWMRALNNPVYAKLVHQLRAQQTAQRQSEQRQFPINSGQTGEIAASEQSQHHFGRVIHYPHEISSPEENAKTLDKLHELNRENQRSLSSSSSSSLNGDDLALESNKIPPPEEAGGDGPPWTRAVESPADSSEAARARFVYGNILLRPESTASDNKQVDSEVNEHSGGRRNSIERLRQLNKNSQPRNSNENFKHSADHQESSESYGRVLVSPPSFAGATQLLSHQQHVSDNQQQHSSSSADEISSSSEQPLGTTSDRWPYGKSTLGKLRKQLESNQFETSAAELGATSVSGGSGANATPADELSAQQTEGSAQIVAAPADAVDPSDAEFEGHWHDGPIDQVELRPIRDEGQATKQHHQQQQQQSTGSQSVFLVD